KYVERKDRARDRRRFPAAGSPAGHRPTWIEWIRGGAPPACPVVGRRSATCRIDRLGSGGGPQAVARSRFRCSSGQTGRLRSAGRSAVATAATSNGIARRRCSRGAEEPRGVIIRSKGSTIQLQSCSRCSVYRLPEQIVEVVAEAA